LLGCADEPPESHVPPGADLVADLGSLAVYKTFEAPLCEGDLRRIRLHWDAVGGLFGESPHADLILYDYLDQVDELASHCQRDYPVGGCASDWGARATPLAAVHELTHVVALNELYAISPALIVEGLAEALGEESIALFQDEFDLSISDLLAVKGEDAVFSGFRSDAHHFMAWSIWHHGLDATLAAYTKTDQIDRSEPDTLAIIFGYDDIEAMQAEYEATAALEYPAWRDYTVRVTLEELADGVDLTPNCDLEHTSLVPIDVGAPTGTRTSITFEIPEPSRYALVYVGLDPWEFEPARIWTSPRFDPLPLGYDPVDNWGEHICFHEAGVFRVQFDRAAGDHPTAFVRFVPEGTLADCP
jgi:hypothetical protein